MMLYLSPSDQTSFPSPFPKERERWWKKVMLFEEPMACRPKAVSWLTANKLARLALKLRKNKSLKHKKRMHKNTGTMASVCIYREQWEQRRTHSDSHMHTYTCSLGTCFFSRKYLYRESFMFGINLAVEHLLCNRKHTYPLMSN